MKIAHIALALSALALVLLLIGGPGYRLGLWDLGFGLLGVMRYSVYLGAAGALLAIIFLLWPRARRDHIPMLVAALLFGVLAVAVPIHVRSTAESLPFIHDITTDTDDPPEFVEVRPLRADAPNPPEYGGEEVARQQHEGYPDLGPLRSDASPDELFRQALATAGLQGWEIVSATPEDGRIEATDTTFWYGFKDDIAIRIRADGDGSRLDMRSKSRVGGSDLGANAARIQDYLTELRADLDSNRRF